MAPHRRMMAFKVAPDPEGGFSAWAADHPIFIQGNTIAELLQNAGDAIRCHLGYTKPQPKATLRFDDEESRPA